MGQKVREVFAKKSPKQQSNTDVNLSTGQNRNDHLSSGNEAIGKGRANRPETVQNGPMKTFSPNGELIEVKSFRNGVPEGRWAKWSSDGKKEFDGFVRGQTKIGHWVLYDRNGLKSSEGNLNKGQKNGVWLEFYPSGKKKERAVYKNGKREGPFVQYAEAGYPLEQGNFHEDQRQGPWHTYAASGTLKEQGKFEFGKKVGIWTSFDAYGRPERQRDHGGNYQAEAESKNGFKEM